MPEPAHTITRSLPLRIGPPEHAILLSLHRYGWLTVEQLCRLHWSAGSLTYVRAKLKELGDAGYVLRLCLPRASRAGSGPSVFTLHRRGLNYLHSLGMEVLPRFRKCEQLEVGYLHLHHSIAVSEILLSFELLCQQVPDLSLAEVRQERLLRRAPAKVALADGAVVSVVPDGWVDLHNRARGERLCLAIEGDRSSMMQKQMRRKFQALLAWVSGPYQEHFQTRSLTIVVVAMGGHARRQALTHWAEQEIEKAGRRDVADLFRFAAWPGNGVSPKDIFLAPIWHTPFAAVPTPLITLEKEET